MPLEAIVMADLVLIVPVVVMMMMAAEISEEERIRDGEEGVGIGPVSVPGIRIVVIGRGRVGVGLGISIRRAAGILIGGVDRDGLRLRLIAVGRSAGRDLVLGSGHSGFLLGFVGCPHIDGGHVADDSGADSRFPKPAQVGVVHLGRKLQPMGSGVGKDRGVGRTDPGHPHELFDQRCWLTGRNLGGGCVSQEQAAASHKTKGDERGFHGGPQRLRLPLGYTFGKMQASHGFAAGPVWGEAKASFGALA
jgi:hypothetical protein